MKNSNAVMRIDLIDGQWYFVDNQSNRVKFDQAVVDATLVTKNRVEGYVVAVHGIDQTLAQHLDIKTLHDLGVTSAHRLGRGPTLRRMRLMENGLMERAQ